MKLPEEELLKLRALADAGEPVVRERLRLALNLQPLREKYEAFFAESGFGECMKYRGPADAAAIAKIWLEGLAMNKEGVSFGLFKPSGDPAVAAWLQKAKEGLDPSPAPTPPKEKAPWIFPWPEPPGWNG